MNTTSPTFEVHRLPREAFTPLSGLERGAVKAAIRACARKFVVEKERAVAFPGVRLEDVAALLPFLGREEGFAGFTMRTAVDGPSKAPIVILTRTSKHADTVDAASLAAAARSERYPWK
jgi:hypothetical protein